MREYQKIVLIELIAIILILCNNFLFRFISNQLLGFVFLTIFFIVIVLLKGFEKDKSEKTLDINFSLISYVICYFVIVYVLGIFAGYARTVYSLDFLTILQNILPVILVIVAEELLRYEVVSKYKNGSHEKIVLTLLVLFLILFDARGAFPLGHDINAIIDNISLIILPSIAKNIAFTFLMYHISWKSVIWFRLLTELPIYMVPIYPNLGNYLTSILEIVFPFIVCLLIYRATKKERMFFVRESKHPGRMIVSACFGIFVVVVILLTSGFFKYYFLAIVSPSMSPNIKRGDVVIVDKLTDKEKDVIEVGDVLVYRNDNRVIVHRVVQKNDSQDGNYTYRTKGDNNDDIDAMVIYEKDIIGVARLRIPAIGYPSVWLSEWR